MNYPLIHDYLNRAKTTLVLRMSEPAPAGREDMMQGRPSTCPKKTSEKNHF